MSSTAPSRRHARRNRAADGSQHRICVLAHDAATAAEPHAALESLRALRDELDEFERSRVADALRAGASFGAIARVLGISRQAAHRRYRELGQEPAARPLPLSSEARRIVLLAVGEASSTAGRGMRSEHLLLGVLRSGGSVSRALEADGIVADAVRECLGADTETVAGAEADEGPAGRAVLLAAAEIARARRASYVGADHIVLAALNAPDGGALRAITALGVTAAAVRERLGC